MSPQVCPTQDDKIKVLRDMIFPQCEKLGQTIIFVRMRETARRLHSEVSWVPSLGWAACACSLQVHWGHLLL